MKMTAHEHIKVIHALDAQSYGATAEAFSSGIDCQGFDEALINFNLGVITATGDVAIQCEESDDNSTWADITGAVVADTLFVVANDQKSYQGRLDLSKRKRYIRIGYDVDDDAAIFSADVILFRKKYLPASPENTILFNV